MLKSTLDSSIHIFIHKYGLSKEILHPYSIPQIALQEETWNYEKKREKREREKKKKKKR
jgi:hypothetical protein